jgi:protein-glutamine gamma-glutamyltransferase
MSFSALYRISFYSMLVCATLVFCVDAPESRFPLLYPLAVAIAAAVAFVTVDRDPARGPSQRLLDVAGICAVVLMIAEYSSDTNLLLLALGHWLVYLQLILMFRPKSAREDWRLFLLGLVQVMIGTVLSQSETLGMLLVLWAVLALWVLGLFSLSREADRARGRMGSPAVPGAAQHEPYLGLLNPAFIFSALRVTMITLALGGVIFLLMPRRTGMGRAPGGTPPGHHLTGFDDEVKLGQMGEILENDEVVMRIELFDDDGNRFQPYGEPLWRGVTMSEYEAGRWKRHVGPNPPTFPSSLPSWARFPAPGRPRGTSRQRIKLEPNDSRVLFGLRPMRYASDGRGETELHQSDGSITRPDTRGGLDYEVWSFRDEELPQIGESLPSPTRLRDQLSVVPAAIRVQLTAIAEQAIAQRVTPDNRHDIRHRARALESYLRDSGEFGYTLQLDRVDKTIDPVLDFLINRKEGHCEYFASALALLLRSVDIPARVVNGFKGGDWNELTRVMTVRQKHAHSWVEAYVDRTPGPDVFPIWLTLDPTPGAERDRSVARVGGFRSNFYQITDAARYVWLFYIVGFDADRQNRLVYSPLRARIAEAKRGFLMMREEWEKTRDWIRLLARGHGSVSIFSGRGFVVSFLALSFLAVLLRLGFQRGRWLLAKLRGHDHAAAALTAGAAHYRRLEQLMAAFDLTREPFETQDEFARKAVIYLTSRGAGDVVDVPALVIDAFYRVRFGHHALSPPDLARLEERLDALAANLQAAQA